MRSKQEKHEVKTKIFSFAISCRSLPSRLKIRFHRFALHGFAYTRWFPNIDDAQKSIQNFGMDRFPCPAGDKTLEVFEVDPPPPMLKVLHYCVGLTVRQRLAQLLRLDTKMWVSDPPSFIVLLPLSLADMQYYHTAPHFSRIYDKVVSAPNFRANAIAYLKAYLKMCCGVPENVSEELLDIEIERLYSVHISQFQVLRSLKREYLAGEFTVGFTSFLTDTFDLLFPTHIQYTNSFQRFIAELSSLQEHPEPIPSGSRAEVSSVTSSLSPNSHTIVE